MTTKRSAQGTVHKVPSNLRRALTSDEGLLAKWKDLTPLARNEWICWVESAKKQETRLKHVSRVCTDLKNGKRRPCCWPGVRIDSRVVIEKDPREPSASRSPCHGLPLCLVTQSLRDTGETYPDKFLFEEISPRTKALGIAMLWRKFP